MQRFPLTVVSVCAPYSWLIAGRLKRYETRTFRRRHRGLIGIHTMQSLAPVGGKAGFLALCAHPVFQRALDQLGIHAPLDEPRGAIIAVANLIEMHPVEALVPHLTDDEVAFGDYSIGRIAWELDGATRLRHPIVTPGKQGLWYWPSHVPVCEVARSERELYERS